MITGRNCQQRTSLLGKPVRFKSSRRDARIKKAQAMVYNFLERPSGKVALCYHALVFCFVFMCLALSVFATIEEHEDEAGEMLYYLEIVIVVWFGFEFFIRSLSIDLDYQININSTLQNECKLH